MVFKDRFCIILLSKRNVHRMTTQTRAKYVKSTFRYQHSKIIIKYDADDAEIRQKNNNLN